MKIHVARLVLLGLFSFAAVGTASATQMKAPVPTSPAVQSPLQPAGNPWTRVASVADTQPATLLAHDDDRWHATEATGGVSSGGASKPGGTGNGGVIGNGAVIGSAAMSVPCTNVTMTSTVITAVEADRSL